MEAKGLNANARQVGGDHYKSEIEVWDFIVANKVPYLEGNVIKYAARAHKKAGLVDLLKAQHYIEKAIEEARKRVPTRGIAADTDVFIKKEVAALSLKVSGTPVKALPKLIFPSGETYYLHAAPLEPETLNETDEWRTDPHAPKNYR